MALGNKKLAQVAVVVRDMDAALDRYSRLLGVDRPDVIITQPGNEVNMSAYGGPSNAQAKLAFFDLGGVQLELIEPMGGESTWQRVLDEKGEGLHHIAFWQENYAATTEALGEAGFSEVQRGDMGEGQYGYFLGEDGVMVEILQAKR